MSKIIFLTGRHNTSKHRRVSTQSSSVCHCKRASFNCYVKIYYWPWTNNHSPNHKVSGNICHKNKTLGYSTLPSPPFFFVFRFLLTRINHNQKYCTAGTASLPWLQQQGASRRSTQTNPCLINEILSLCDPDCHNSRSVFEYLCERKTQVASTKQNGNRSGW